MNKLLLCSILLCFISTASAEDEFLPVRGDRALVYPRDHGAHPEFGTEWWYVTGHLRTDTNKTFGFELVFFRVGLHRESQSRSAWKSNSLYLAHFALTDDSRGTFVNFDRKRRASFAQAGAEEESLHVWLDTWQLRQQGDDFILKANAEGNDLSLKLKTKKPLVLHGAAGYSEKGPEPGNASYYSSFTRLVGEGSIQTNGRAERITMASAWLDHEFTSSTLARGDQGWDWFALQFASGEDLMVYQLRDREGLPTKFSSGTFITKDGTTVHLKSSDFEISVLDHWKSPTTAISYPSKWNLKIPKLDLDVEIKPTVSEQELVTKESTGVTYWEGRCSFTEKKSATEAGNAYVELVGYGTAHSQE